MSPGVNNQSHTGTLPKSNRRSQQFRENVRHSVNQNNRFYQTPDFAPQRANNLLNWQPVRESQSKSTTKNSNTKLVPTLHPVPTYYSGDLGHSNNPADRYLPNICDQTGLPILLKMSIPGDHTIQSSQNGQPIKQTNTEKMPDRGQVETRLNQIRGYIKVTSSMMESLSQSNDPKAISQREKLNRMVEDLYDSEQKLSKLLENRHKFWNENGQPQNIVNSEHEQQLRKKVEESQQKLDELQEQQAQLVDMQNRVRERLDAAREAQRALLLEEQNEKLDDEQSVHDLQSSNAAQLEREAEALRGKLAQLQNKKTRMDHLVAELQAAEALENSSANSKMTVKDKAAELEAMKSQLSHLKALMNDATRGREFDSINSESHQTEENSIHSNTSLLIPENTTNTLFENGLSIHNNTVEHPSLEQIQSVTRELKEQHALLHAARDELRRLKQEKLGQNLIPSIANSTASLNQAIINEKKQTNNINIQNQNSSTQDSRRQIENLMRKDHCTPLKINENDGLEFNSRRNSISQTSQHSTSNLWPPTSTVNGHNIGINESSDIMLDVGSHPLTENTFANAFWGLPAVSTNQSLQTPNGFGSSEYYRQLLLGSQAQQLQMMSSTIQHCCQLLWAQQREIQSLRNAMTTLQLQVRQCQPLENQAGYSNTSRSNYRMNGDAGIEASNLPPSGSLPNLGMLPNGGCPTLARSPPSPQRYEQPQLNNQVPPGNRANNYWDNFRSYSRQNLLSGANKTSENSSTSTANFGIASNFACGLPNTAGKEKSNRENCIERFPMNLTEDEEAAYCNQNFPNHINPQLHDRDTITMRNTCGTSSENIPFEDAEEILKENECMLMDAVQMNEDSSTRVAEQISEREDLKSILTRCLQILETKKCASPTLSTIVTNSSITSDEELEDEACQSTPIHDMHNFTGQTDSAIKSEDTLNTNSDSFSEIFDANLVPVLSDNLDILEQINSSGHQFNINEENAEELLTLRPDLMKPNQIQKSEENATCFQMNETLTSISIDDLSAMSAINWTLENIKLERENDGVEFVLLPPSQSSKIHKPQKQKLKQKSKKNSS